jgi:chromosome segregation ATPase
MTSVPTQSTTTTTTSPQLLTESKPPVTTRANTSSSDVFLTPRIIDENAYTQYAAAIRELLAELDGKATTLTETSADTDKLCGALRQAAQQLKTRLDNAAKADQLLAARAKAANSTITAINDAIGSDTQLDALAEKVIARHRAALEARLTASLTDLEQSLTAKLTAAETRAAEAEARASQAEQAADRAEQRLTELTAKFLALTEQADTIDESAAGSLQAAEAAAERAASNALEATEQLRLLAESIQKSAEENTADIEARLGPVRDLLDNAAALLGSPDQPGTLHTAIENATSTAGQLTQANTALEQHLAKTTSAQTAIADIINTAAESLESFEHRRDELRTSVERDLDALAAEVSPLERATTTLRRTLDELAERTQSIYNDIARAQQDSQGAADAIAQALNTAIAKDDPTAEAERRIAAMQEAAQAITEQTLKQVEEAAEWLAALAAQAYPPQPINHG